MDTNNLVENSPSEAIVSETAGEQPTVNKRKRRRRRKGNGAAFQAPAAQPQNVGDLQASADLTEAGDTAVSEHTGGGGGRRRKRNRRKKNKGGGAQQQAQPQPVNNTPQPKPNEQAKFFRKQNNGGFSQGNGNGGGRRNRQQRRGGFGFVGPMDHLYRGGDNLAESTIGVNGNIRHGGGRSNNQNLNVNGNIASYADSVTVPVRADAPTRVYCFIEDLFFHAKIRETAKSVGIKVEFVKNDKEQIERMLETASSTPVLVVVDLNNHAAKPLPLIKKLRPKLSKGSSLIGFVQHVQGELKVEAQEAGCDVVMPRSAFSSNLSNILRRYLDEEGDEPNFNTEGAITY